jgi:hypothetical protein
MKVIIERTFLAINMAEVPVRIDNISDSAFQLFRLCKIVSELLLLCSLPEAYRSFDS